MSDSDAVVEQMELVVGLAEGQIPHPDLETVARDAAVVRSRVGHLGSTLVLALVGGTGVGKSSLLNGLAGEPVASTGVLRPHTTESLAWVPAKAEPALGGLLDELGVERRIEHESLPGVAVLDLTDVDSVDPEHRRVAETILPSVDLIMFVLDPVKYGDADLHRNLIAPVATDPSRLLFALNRVDTVAEERRPAVLAHLAELLAGDGIAKPILFPVAADPSEGPPLGVERIVEHLRDRLDEKRIRLARVIDDAARVGDAVARAAGVEAGGSTGFDAVWAAFLDAARAAVTNGVAAHDEEHMLGALERLVAGVSATAGPMVGPAVRGILGPQETEAAISDAVGAARSARPERDPVEAFAAVLEERVGGVLREALWGRAKLAAAVAGLAVDVAAARARLD